FAYAYCRGRLFDTVEIDDGQYDTVADIFWATGACLFIRSDIFWKAGALDEDFFAHQEEIDLCWRIKNMGYRIVCIPQSVIYHVGGGSLPKGNPRKTYLNFRNNLMMMFKNLDAVSLCWKFPFRLVLDQLAALYLFLKNRDFAELFSIYKAQGAAIRRIPSLLKKRKQGRHFSAAHLSGTSVVWQYYVRGKRKFSEL
ncbi:MAG TPA: hypothetical protein VG603_10875, partial [Chitinophagales bacterium]|nr:hypothetical protein [Chitinophagales bacterium]